MKNNRYGYAMNEVDTDASDSQQQDNSSGAEPQYEFDGYDIEINTKVTLLPKATNKM